MADSIRAGRYISQPQGYKAFVPNPLPPEPPLALDAALLRLLSQADCALGRLDGAGAILPNPDFFVSMYVRQEAVLSSQIEGTQSTLEDVLAYEAGDQGAESPRDLAEVVNYVKAMNHGLERLTELPLSLRLIREIHGRLLEGVRGGDRTPGEFRRSQNWIGPAGCTLKDAAYVPPPVHEMLQALDNLEKFLHDESLPILVQCALAHAQFETIHPFLDGNGRVGRLLITFLLCWRGVLRRPLLYLSLYLKAHRAEYYDRLQAVRVDGDWEGWLRFFLAGVAEVADGATRTARAILDLREEHRQLVVAKARKASSAHALLDMLFRNPIVTPHTVQRGLGCAFDTANRLVSDFAEWGLLRETTGKQRNRRFRYQPYLALFPSA
ncbi:MAG TPA: Fic family protein [Planctomycetota bacterium]|nr:Fic family protein [Planctomycetota bacterium]